MTRLLILWLLAAVLAAGEANAGTPCEPKKADATNFIKAMKLAERTMTALDKSGAQVALIARAGQDLSKYGLRYSHMGYVWRDHPQGRWLVVHELNQCGSARSALFDEGLGNFFLDDMHAYETRIVVPGSAAQARIVAMLASTTPLRLHDGRYNMVAFAYSTDYQNSNQWLLETYAASVSDMPIDGRAQAQAWLKLAAYEPITLDIPAMTRLGARMFRASVSFDDHPFERRMAGKIDTVTVDSVLRFVHQRDPHAWEIVVMLPR
ncbi:DUF2145 domain-containing protein [Massilia sp. TWR1-2-2]|uniref:DUF2145 domain-containing protein n=1 Tax=Massilia sp. TWR1-2-2 TaxID=2804584 RepID=UPI003CE7401A